MKWLSKTKQRAAVYIVVCHDSDRPDELYVRAFATREDAELDFLYLLPDDDILEEWSFAAGDPLRTRQEYADGGVYCSILEGHSFVLELRELSIDASKMWYFDLPED